jgi:hypothetical protein
VAAVSGGDNEMKVISLWQPWASAIPMGLKTIETRSWVTNYRGPLAIHAAKTKDGLNPNRFSDDTLFQILQTMKFYGADIKKLPFGAIIATAELVDCIEIPNHRADYIYLQSKDLRTNIDVYSREILFGDYTPGRFAWILSDIRALEKPILAIGQQGFWDFDLKGMKL